VVSFSRSRSNDEIRADDTYFEISIILQFASMKNKNKKKQNKKKKEKKKK